MLAGVAHDERLDGLLCVLSNSGGPREGEGEGIGGQA